MRSQLERDEVTVTIATSLALLMVVLVLGVAAAGLLAWATDFPDSVVATVLVCFLASAISANGSYLWRHRRP